MCHTRYNYTNAGVYHRHHHYQQVYAGLECCMVTYKINIIFLLDPLN